MDSGRKNRAQLAGSSGTICQFRFSMFSRLTVNQSLTCMEEVVVEGKGAVWTTGYLT